MNGKSEHFLHYAIRDQIAKYYANGITPFRFKNGVNSAARASRRRVAKNKSEGFERGYALTDENRNILKRTMMTSETAYQRNKVTKLVGLAWVVCGYSE
jgi:hypothetical protein